MTSLAWFGGISLAYKFAIILGLLIIATFLAGFVKIMINRRRLARNSKLADLENAEQMQQREALAQRQLDEGDLFGVRAIESGFYGGVSQSRPGTPSVISTMSGGRSPEVTDLSEKLWQINQGDRSSSVLTTESPPLKELSAPLVAIPPPVQENPSRLRLQPSDAELNGRRNHDLAPLIATKGSNPRPQSTALDPTTTPSIPSESQPACYDSTPDSQRFLPGFPCHQTANSAGMLLQKIESDIQVMAPKDKGKLKQQIGYLHPFPLDTNFQGLGSQNPKNNKDISPQTTSMQSPESYFPPELTTAIQAGSSPTWMPSHGIVQDSTVRKHAVSILSQTNHNNASRIRSLSASSSIYSSDTSSYIAVNETIRTSPSSHQKTRYTSRTSNYLHQHSRKSSPDKQQSRESLKARHSYDHNRLHYDHSSTYCDRSDSVQSRAVDFDPAWSSPFGNSNALPPSREGSSSSSISSKESSLSVSTTSDPCYLPSFDKTTPSVTRKSPPLTLKIPTSQFSSMSLDSSHSAVLANSPILRRGRSASEMSQGSSIGDLYDAYKASTLTQQQIGFTPAQ